MRKIRLPLSLILLPGLLRVCCNSTFAARPVNDRRRVAGGILLADSCRQYACRWTVAGGGRLAEPPPCDNEPNSQGPFGIREGISTLCPRFGLVE